MDLRNYETYAQSGNPLVGATVELFAATLAHPNLGSVLSTTLTDTNGAWQFLNLADGDYDVKVSIPGTAIVKWYKAFVKVGLQTLRAGNFGGGMLLRRNRLINGGMQISQRRAFDSALTSVDNTYQASDRWRTLEGTTAGTAPNVQPSVTINLTATTHSFAFQSVGGTGKFGIFQVIQWINGYDLRGGVVSLQARLMVTGTGFSNVKMGVLQRTAAADATTGDPISAWNADGTNPTPVADWLSAFAGVTANLGVTATPTVFKLENIPISGSMTNLAVLIWSDDVSTTLGDFFVVSDVQLESGPFCTPFERMDRHQSLRDCMPYCQKTFVQGVTPAQNVGAAGAESYRCVVAAANANAVYWRFPVVMRATPTITTYNPGAANANWRNLSLGADSGAASALNASDRGVELHNAQAAGDALGHSIALHALATAEI